MPTISGKRTIVLKAYSGNHEEGPMAAAGSPGMNVNMTAAAAAQLRETYTPGPTPVGGTAAGAAAGPVRVLKEDALQGKTIDDAYAIGDNAFVFIPKKGDVVQVLVAAGQTVLKGDGGYAIASGLWNAATGAAAINRIGQFLEASAGALAANTHMRLRVD